MLYENMLAVFKGMGVEVEANEEEYTIDFLLTQYEETDVWGYVNVFPGDYEDSALLIVANPFFLCRLVLIELEGPKAVMHSFSSEILSLDGEQYAKRMVSDVRGRLTTFAFRLSEEYLHS